jgi:spermidine synthase
MSLRSFLLVAVLGVAVVLSVTASRTRVVFDEDSASGRIRVVERSDGLRELYIGGSRGRQTALYPARPAHLELPYTRVAMAALAWLPEDGRVLFVGLGGGAMPTFTRSLFPRARIDAVELEARVVEVAREWFGFREDSLMSAHVADGRVFIEEAQPGSWDVIVLDAFSDGDVPLALATEEFLEAVRRALRPGGVVASNLHTGSPRYEAMVATYQAVFPEVGLIQVPQRGQRILLAGGGGVAGTPTGEASASAGWSGDRADVIEAVRALARERGLGFDLETIVAGGYEVAAPAGAASLRDSR